jgi:hypothetical protein
MRKRIVFAVALHVLFCFGLGGLAQADPAEGSHENPPSPNATYLRTDFGAEISRSSILELPEVVEALKLTEDQRRSVAESLANPKTSRRFGPPAKDAGVRPEPEAAEDIAMRTLLNPHTQSQALINTSAETSRLSELVERPQMQRMNQIYAQILDGHALSDPVISGQLELTPAQQRQLDQIREEAALVFVKQMYGLLVDTKPDATAQLVKVYQEVLDAYGKRMTAILTPQQTVAFQNLKGSPVAISEGSRKLLTSKGVGRYLEFMSQAQTNAAAADSH